MSNSATTKKGQLVLHRLDGPCYDINEGDEGEGRFFIWGWEIPKENFSFWVKNKDVVEMLENMTPTEQNEFLKEFFPKSKKVHLYFEYRPTPLKLERMRRYSVLKFLEQ